MDKLAEQKETVEKKNVAEFVREVRGELNKVSWPTKDALVSYTGVVGFGCAIRLLQGCFVSCLAEREIFYGTEG